MSRRTLDAYSLLSNLAGRLAKLAKMDEDPEWAARAAVDMLDEAGLVYGPEVDIQALAAGRPNAWWNLLEHPNLREALTRLAEEDPDSLELGEDATVEGWAGSAASLGMM